MLNINPVHVRRDLMLLGISGSHSAGYDVQELIRHITEKLECREGKNACIIGFGHMGRAALELFGEGFAPASIVAIFDTSSKSVGKIFSEVPCYSVDKITQIIESQNISLAVLTEADEEIDSLISLLLACGIRGILNLTPVQLNVPDHIHLEEFDMVTTMIKLAYFSEKRG